MNNEDCGTRGAKVRENDNQREKMMMPGWAKITFPCHATGAPRSIVRLHQIDLKLSAPSATKTQQFFWKDPLLRNHPPHPPPQAPKITFRRLWSRLKYLIVPIWSYKETRWYPYWTSMDNYKSQTLKSFSRPMLACWKSRGRTHKPDRKPWWTIIIDGLLGQEKEFLNSSLNYYKALLRKYKTKMWEFYDAKDPSPQNNI